MCSDTSNLKSLNERRRKAVKLRLEGRKIAEIAAIVDLSAPTIIAAHKQFLTGGWPAVDSSPRGRKAGNLALSDELLKQVKEAAENTPNNSLPWSLQLLEQHCREAHGAKISARSLGSYLEQWGLGAENQYTRCKDEGSQIDWLNTTYKAFTQQARQNNATVFWMGRSSTDHDGNIISATYAHTTRGKYYWIAAQTSNHVFQASDFLQRLTRTGNGPIAVVLADGNLLDDAEFQQFTNSTDQITVIAHPDHRPRCNNPQIAETTATNTTATAPAEPETIQSHRKTPTMKSLTHLQRLEAESIHIMREVVANADKPVMLYSIGKDSAVMLHLALKAFYPAKPPFALLHVDTGWKFREMYEFRDKTAKRNGLELITHINKEGVEKDVNPFTHGSALHTDIMKTQALKQALDKHGFDVALGGARRDEEASRAKERIFSFRTPEHHWDPKNQRPELWNLYNTQKMPGESIRAFPISNWTELDIWQYIYKEDIPVVPLYFAAKRPVVMRDGQLIMVDDDRLPMNPGEAPLMKTVRFRTLGCYPLTAAIESNATTVPEIIRETLTAEGSEREGRMIDHDSAASMERKKQEGYF
jgi:sulfate adenylyltransferase subunit 2